MAKISVTSLVVLALFISGGIFIIFNWPHFIASTTLFAYRNTHSLHLSNTGILKDELDMALEKVSMGNKTLIITIINKAYAEPHRGKYPSMFDIFLEGFWVGEETRPLLDHVLVVAMDSTAYKRCMFRHLHCYRLETDGVDFTKEEVYMSSDFIKMMWRRTLFLLDVLKRGYNFIFTDTDVLWLRDPFSRLSRNGTEDLQISTDIYNGNSYSDQNMINTGFYMIKSNNKTISLFEKWYEKRSNSTGMKEQDVLANLMNNGIFKNLNLKVRFLDTLYFSGFCSDSKDVKEVATVHANCCRSISAKVADLKAILRDWNKIKKSITMNKNSLIGHLEWSKHISCINSWHVNNTSLRLKV